MNKIRILVVDDHNFIVEGIIAMLNNNNKEFTIVSEANNGKEAVDKFLQYKPDIVIMDLSMPIMSGLDATKKILSLNPDARIIALTQHDDTEYIFQFINIGGMGYLLKNSKKNEFIDAINAVYSGKKYFSNEVSNLMMNHYLSANQEARESVEREDIPLTIREIEIIRLIALDLSNFEISEKLGISQRTVETHRRNLMQKLKVKSVVALLRYAVQHNIITMNK